MELAPLPGFPGIQRHPGFQERLTHSRGRRKWEPRLASRAAWNHFGSKRRRASDNGVFGEWHELASASQHAKLTHRAPAGAAGAFGASAGIFSTRGSLGAAPLTVRSGFGRVGQTKRAKAIVSCEESPHVGVPGFRVERLQNLVSGVWLKRRASVAAEASGRGLGGEG